MVVNRLNVIQDLNINLLEHMLLLVNAITNVRYSVVNIIIFVCSIRVLLDDTMPSLLPRFDLYIFCFLLNVCIRARALNCTPLRQHWCWLVYVGLLPQCMFLYKYFQIDCWCCWDSFYIAFAALSIRLPLLPIYSVIFCLHRSPKIH